MIKKLLLLTVIITTSCGSKSESTQNNTKLETTTETEKERSDRVFEENRVKDSVRLVIIEERKDFPYPEVGESQTMLDNYSWVIGTQPHQIRHGLNSIKIRATPKNYKINKIDDGYEVVQDLKDGRFLRQSFYSKEEADNYIIKRTVEAQEEVNSLYLILKNKR